MRIIIIDGWHRGEVINWHSPQPEIKLLKPKCVTVCDCDGPGSGLGDEFTTGPEKISYRCAFRSEDGEVALFSTSGKSMDIFKGFDHAYRKNPYARNEVLTFGCHDENAWK
ncbi:MAG: hypothetical protein QOI58_4115 [Thermoanaerobaculia bacterium]|jgi:hypothetical protein|nr:hypothetical protein [Thermoanaerobaculia bacterium]